jgi:hypothetical protein
MLLALAGLALATAAGLAQPTVLTNSYTNTFDAAGNTAPFTGGSVASWIYWYGLSYNNTAMTNDPTHDAQTNANSGSLMVYLPFGAKGDQGVFFGTLDNGNGYDGSEIMDARTVTNIAFDILFAPGTAPNSSGQLGSITMSFFPATWENGGDFSLFRSLTIPAKATNQWVHFATAITNFLATEPIDGLTNCAGIGFDYNSYSGYPTNPVTFWIDNVEIDVASTPPPPPPPPTVAAPQRATPGLNLITTAIGQYNRYNLATVNDTGYTFVGQSNVTYSWNIAGFPGAPYSGFQQQLFLIPASQTATVNTEGSADYSETNCIFVTVQYESSTSTSTVTNGGIVTTNTATNWFGVMDFRYKTNQDNGNAMLFNTLSPTNASNTNGWPVEPIGSVQSPSPLGTWSVTFNHDTNVTLTAPNGATNNFYFPEASAQLFADPLYVFVGDQPNNNNAQGQTAVLNSFSITGSQTPLLDNFTNDAAVDTTIWVIDGSDVNAIQFVPPGVNYWIGWTTPDTGFDLQSNTNLTATNGWTTLTGTTPANPLPTFRILKERTVLITSPNLPGTNAGYFRLIQDQ